MSKLKELKEAVKNPPPERLAKIEYRSHALQALGIVFVCGMLIYKGFWYVIFAMIFGVGISYSQGVTAFQKYKMISELVQQEKPEDYMKDLSWTRRRSKIIQHSYGPWGRWISSAVAVILTVALIDPHLNRWILAFVYPIMMILIYIIIYYYGFYYPARDLYYDYLSIHSKGGKKNAKKEKSSRRTR